MTGDSLAVWALVVAIAVPTFLVRYSFIGLFGWLEATPGWVRRVLALVPAAVFAALVVPDVVTVHSTLVATLGRDRVAAAAVAAAIAYRTESDLATVVVGMGVLWTLHFVVPALL